MARGIVGLAKDYVTVMPCLKFGGPLVHNRGARKFHGCENIFGILAVDRVGVKKGK